MALRLLVIEDNPDLIANLYAFLEPLGYVLDNARDGESGLAQAVSGDYDAIILDLMLPRLDGLIVCRRLRHEYYTTTPILMLTARDMIEDRVLGLREGADDYLIKPFSLSELEARIQALVRRAHAKQAPKILHWKDLSVNIHLPQAERQGHTITLTPTEHKLLLRLIRSAPEVVTRQQLEYALWGEDVPESSALRTHIHDLRRRIDKNFNEPLIETIHGIGFRLR